MATTQIAIPDVLGEPGRQQATDQFVSRMLAGLQEEEVRLNVLQHVNAITDEDIVIPGETDTFATRREALADQQRKITDAFPESAERLAASS